MGNPASGLPGAPLRECAMAGQEQLAAILSHVLGEQRASMMTAMEEMLGRVVPPRDRGNDNKVMAKYFRVDKFDGGRDKWEEWSFTFLRNVRSMSRTAYEVLKKYEGHTDDVDEELVLNEEEQKRSAEVYDVMCQVCSGEALMVVKSVDDMRGVRAWQVLYRKYNPRTMARGARMMYDAVRPPKIKELSEFETAVAKWEEKVKRLTTQFDEKLTERMKIAIFTGMLPLSLQDYVFVHMEKDCGYEEVRDKVGRIVSNKVAISTGPAPMDVGDVGGQGDEWWYEEEQYDDEGEHHVDVITGRDQCRNCHGYGHYARDCPTKVKGKGKASKGGDKGKGKAKGKGAQGDDWRYKGGVKSSGYSFQQHSGGGKGGAYEHWQYNPKGKSKGKGYQGVCWTCGKIGHKASECTAMDTNCVENDGDQTVEIEGMWDVGNVLVKAKGLEVRNKYAALEEEEEEENDEKVTTDGSENQGVEHRKKSEPTLTMKTYAQAVGTKGGWRSAAPRNKRTAPAGTVEKTTAPDPDAVEIAEVGIEEAVANRMLTRPSTMTFNVAGVCKPLVSAVRVVEAGNRIVMDSNGSYVENKRTGEKMQLRSKKGVFVFDVKYQDGDTGEITLDSGAGVSVWPKDHKRNLISLGPKKEGLKLVAANGTAIENVGQAKVIFQGVAPTAPFSGQP